MIYFQQQVKANHAARCAMRIQRWYRGVRVRKSLTRRRRVRFQTFRSPEFYATVAKNPCRSADSKQTRLETEMIYLENELKKFYWDFERDFGRAPSGPNDLRPMRAINVRYLTVKHEIAATQRAQAQSVQRPYQGDSLFQSCCSSIETSFSVNESRVDQHSASSSELLVEERQPFETPSAFHFMDSVTQTGTHDTPVRKNNHPDTSTPLDTINMVRCLEDECVLLV